MPTSNELFRDAMVRHQIGLQRVQASIRQEILLLLDLTERDLASTLARRLKAMVPKEGLALTSANIRRLQALEKSISIIRRRATNGMFASWKREMIDLLKHEAKFVASAMGATSPVVLGLALPEVATLLTLIAKFPFWVPRPEPIQSLSDP